MIFVIILLLPYLVVPIFIRRNQFFNKNIHIRLIESSFIPKENLAYLEQADTAILSLGFEHRIDVLSLDGGEQARIFLRIYVDKINRMIAIATSISTQAKNAISNFIEISTRTSNGFEVCTNNSDFVAAPIEPKNRKVTSLPKDIDVEALFDIHQHKVKECKMARDSLIVPACGEEFLFLKNIFENELKRQVLLGCLYLDRFGVYRPTWAGSFIIGWYSMWPISFFRKSMQKLKAKILIKKRKKTRS